jgi:hypothetical protein
MSKGKLTVADWIEARHTRRIITENHLHFYWDRHAAGRLDRQTERAELGRAQLFTTNRQIEQAYRQTSRRQKRWAVHSQLAKIDTGHQAGQRRQTSKG